MAATNRVYYWRDGERLLVDLNGATVEAESLRFDQHIVTLQFQAIPSMMKGDTALSKVVTTPHAMLTRQDDPLHDESLW